MELTVEQLRKWGVTAPQLRELGRCMGKGAMMRPPAPYGGGYYTDGGSCALGAACEGAGFAPLEIADIAIRGKRGIKWMLCFACELCERVVVAYELEHMTREAIALALENAADALDEADGVVGKNQERVGVLA